MDWQNRIVIDPDILVGKPVVARTHSAVEFIIDLLAQGQLAGLSQGLTPAILWTNRLQIATRPLGDVAQAQPT